jgi:hypothetical protein
MYYSFIKTINVTQRYTPRYLFTPPTHPQPSSGSSAHSTPHHATPRHAKPCVFVFFVRRRLSPPCSESIAMTTNPDRVVYTSGPPDPWIWSSMELWNYGHVPFLLAFRPSLTVLVGSLLLSIHHPPINPSIPPHVHSPLLSSLG